MTRTLGWINDARDGLCSPSSSPPKHSPRWPSLPADAPDILRRNTIFVRDPERVLLVAEAKRRRQFQVLVKRITAQLRDGCQDSSCRTPTCFTFRSRVSPASLRRLTAVSARTMACFLAAQEDPESNLCPYLRHADCDIDQAQQTSRSGGKGNGSFRQQTSRTRDGPSKTAYAERETSAHGRAGNHPLQNPLTIQTRFPLQQNECPAEDAPAEDKAQSIPTKKPPKKDSKSFAQNLFDTLPLSMLDWLPVASPGGATDFACEGSEVYVSPGRDPQQPVTCPMKKQTQGHTNANSAKDSASRTDRLSIKDGEDTNTSSRPYTSSLEVSDHIGRDILRPSLKTKKRHSIALLSEDRQSSAQSPMKPRRHSFGLLKPASAALSSLARSHGPAIEPPDILLKPSRAPEGTRAETGKHECGILNLSSRDKFADGIQGPVALKASSTDEAIAEIGSAHGRSRNDLDEASGDKQNGCIKCDIDLVKPPQSLTHFSYHIVNAMHDRLLSADVVAFEERYLRNYFQRHITENYTSSHNLADLRHRETQAYVQQSIHYVLSNPDTLLESFKDLPVKHRLQSVQGSELLLHPQSADETFRLLLEEDSALVFQSLWQGVEALFAPPPELVPPRSSRQKAHLITSTCRGAQSPLGNRANGLTIQRRYLTDMEACHIILVCFHALMAAVPRSMLMIGESIRQLRSLGKVAPDAPKLRGASTEVIGDVMRCIEVFENEMSVRLVCRLLRGLATRLHFASVLKDKAAKTGKTLSNTNQPDMIGILCTYLQKCHVKGPSLLAHSDTSGQDVEADQPTSESPYSPWSMPAVLVEWIRTAMLKSWDGKAEVSRFGVMGSAITVLAVFHEKRDYLGLSPEVFYMPYFFDRLDPVDVTAAWISSTNTSRTVHLLSNPFLFTPGAMTTYFRALNFASMSRAFEGALMTYRQALNLALLNPQGSKRGLLTRLSTAVTTYLVLEVRRDNLLGDAFDQLWRRERRELMRPLKVRMGLGEGEEGLDHGGVQQEFFRIAISQALDPDYGLFTTDPETRISWFQPLSAEPLYRFELIGLLVGLAIYNGATLPVNFPQALYRKLLGLPVNEIAQIKDGWPRLTKGLVELLNWSDGDVKDVFVRTYDFSFELWGRSIDINMQKICRDDNWPRKDSAEGVDSGQTIGKAHSGMRQEDVIGDDCDPSMASDLLGQRECQRSLGGMTHSDMGNVEAELVTNKNRKAYVEDYIYWLTDKSIQPQFEAFAKGFFTCVDKRALSVFTPTVLQTVVEGLQDIDMDALEKTARYEDGYSPEHRLIRDFWSVVHHYSPSRKRQLLEFVTASERVPVSGINSILFVVQRSGPDSNRLPTSLTCFGRLLLPEYSSRRKLKHKLRLALENAKGFGVP